MGIFDSTIGALKSITVLSSMLGIIAPSLLKVWEHAQSIDPVLLSDTQTFIVTTVAGALALFGRWKATKLIKGLF